MYVILHYAMYHTITVYCNCNTDISSKAKLNTHIHIQYIGLYTDTVNNNVLSEPDTDVIRTACDNRNAVTALRCVR